MTDARFPDRWLNDRRLLRLSDPDFRSFLVSLAWSVSNRTDGRIDPEDLTLIASFRESSVPGLVAAGLWVQDGTSWLISDFESTQTSRAQLDGLDQRRHQDRERQARKRARDQQVEVPVSRDSPRDITRDVHRETEDRQGKARTGSTTGPRIDLVTGEVTEVDDWPPVAGAPVAVPPSAQSAPVTALRPTCSVCGADLSTSQHTAQQRSRRKCGRCVMNQAAAS